MNPHKKAPSHFKGKDALEHVIEARIRGYKAREEIHGTEIPGHYSAAADAAKETALILLILWTLFRTMPISLDLFLYSLFFIFITGWLIWKVGRSAILGYSRLERLHRLIEEERWEIEHHRAQEKEELAALYAAKGFSGKLLDEVVHVLMADDNRLLQVMLEEELGLNLGSYEHPLKQATGALVGAVGSALIMSFGFFLLPAWGPPLCACIVISLAAASSAQLERNKIFPLIIWNLATAAVAVGAVYFITQIFMKS